VVRVRTSFHCETPCILTSPDEPWLVRGKCYVIIDVPEILEFQAPRVGRSAARRHRRGAWADPRGGDVLPAGAVPALPRASAPQSSEQSPREPVAGDCPAGAGLLRGGVLAAGHGAAR
jgi:hypothetical protein